jgi:hypothetical protein
VCRACVRFNYHQRRASRRGAPHAV